MSTLTLFYGVPSGCSFGSIVALEWSGQPYQLCRIEMPAQSDTEAYHRINPLGETPTLLDSNGQVITESMAILNHIMATSSNSAFHYQQGATQFNQFNQKLAFLNTTLFNAFSPLWYSLEHASSSDATQTLHDYGTAQVEKAFTALERMLTDKIWLMGTQISFVDAYYAGIARWLKYHNVIDINQFPNCQRLDQQLQEQAAVKFAHAIEQQQPAQSSGHFLGHISLEQIT
ncbi:glutathione S-transferase N-terminal domain-containing protein [Acinetobacter sp. NIPH 2699]|uniref:glutathione S-transferase family protein n=1 Tax=Acinetobacter sp. NIPH 2699 TaxID=2923433 RepID=UPI001F4B4406|nr:glutathione S-transferase N-terminal domain-containing protein [Acinetobacter sp. NIPH 2699]MCH7336507.1 glutathione S-transferase N-terminal domain-containing protein [Acinetobacter sp. NIPH 2699]